MKQRLLLILLCISSSVLAQHTISWYKMMVGTIGKYPVTMHLHKAGHNYYGYYYYHSQQKPVYFNGEDTTVKDKVSLIAFSSNDATETFTFSINETSAAGTWKKDETSSVLSFAAKETPPPIPMTYVYTQGEKKLRQAIKGSPQATFFAGSIWPTGSSSLDIFFQKIIAAKYDDRNQGMSIGKVMLRHRDDFFKSYLEDFKDVKPADFKESSFMYNIDQSQNMLVVYQSPKIITIADFVYIYSGGAHGNYGTTYASYDLLKQKKLTLNDVLTLQGRKKLNDLLARAVRTQFKLKPSDKLSEVLFEDKIAPNENFYITGKGLGFSYQPYEIAAYALGEINLFLTFRELDPFLQPSFRSRLQ